MFQPGDEKRSRSCAAENVARCFGARVCRVSQELGVDHLAAWWESRVIVLLPSGTQSRVPIEGKGNPLRDYVLGEGLRELA